MTDASFQDLVEFLDDGEVVGLAVDSTEDIIELWVEPEVVAQAVDRVEFLEIIDDLTYLPGTGTGAVRTCQFLQPTETPNGVVVDFTVPVVYVAGTLGVYLNGVLQVPTIDFTETSTSGFTMTDAPLTGDYVVVHVTVES